jgi:hypothetical protein
MTSNIGESGVLYNQVQIPDLDDAADIREALRIYHYGSRSSNPNSTPEGQEFFANSIAGELLSLEESKRNVAVETLSAGINLDSQTENGVYYASQSSVTSGSNYPLIDGARRPGLLLVESIGSGAGAVVVQRYIVIDTVASNNATVFVRTRTNGIWSPSTWSRLSESNHTHDERYTQTILLTPELNIRPKQINGKNASGTDLSGTRQIVVAAPIEVEGKQVPNITPAQTLSLQPGDIWFW